MKLSDKELYRLKVVMVYRTIPSMGSDIVVDEMLELKGLVKLSKHGATITEKGAEEIKNRGIFK